MRECLKISVKELNPKGHIRGFLGTLYREDGKTIVKEILGISKKWVVEDLGYHAKWYNENMLNDENDENDDTKSRNEASEEGTSETD